MGHTPTNLRATDKLINLWKIKEVGGEMSFEKVNPTRSSQTEKFGEENEMYDRGWLLSLTEVRSSTAWTKYFDYDQEVRTDFSTGK
jgi:hypothetical protein